MRFSKNTQCFYPKGIDYPSLPADIVDCTRADFDLAISRKAGETLDFIGGNVVIVPVPAAQLQAQALSTAWSGIKAKRTAIELGGVQVGTKWYHTDDSSRIKYLGLYKLAEQALASGGTGATVLQYNGVDIRWKTMDGTFVAMTVQLAQDVYFAVFGLDMAAFSAAETHRAAMEGAADPAAYDFSAGWPASFQVA